MAADRMPGLAQLIELHERNSHILRSVLDVKIGDKPLENEVLKEDAKTEGCTALQEAIGQLRPDQLRRQSIPEAIAELREIGNITEKSVEVIMARTEALMDIDPAFEDAMEILQACSFQDIAGQRLAKVTQLLENLEERLHSLVHETGIDDCMDAIGEDELEAERRAKELILHGPQLTGEGVSQDEIDALLGA
ncbi:MAG: protein phosphatase CheZ [Hyphomicrobiaceae bacterium]|nr:protein phosphatase CheZ [Hyphomicrobiaceae bacterium]